MLYRTRNHVGSALLVLGVVMLFAGAETIAAFLHATPGDGLGLIPYEPPALLIGLALGLAGIRFPATVCVRRRSGSVPSIGAVAAAPV